jgi:hypothetical protein
MQESLANYERLLVLCGDEYRCLSGENLDALPAILESKEDVIQGIQQNSSHYAPMWSRIEEGDSAMDALGDVVGKVQEIVEVIRKRENKISELVAERVDEVRKALGAISKSDKALDAYKPVMTYSPRFVDRIE